MCTRSLLVAAVDTGLSNLYLVYMAVTKSAASFMRLQILGLLMYDGPRSRDFRDPDDPGWGGSYWLRNSQYLSGIHGHGHPASTVNGSRISEANSACRTAIQEYKWTVRADHGSCLVADISTA